MPGDFYRVNSSTLATLKDGGEELQWRGTVRLGPNEGIEYHGFDGLTDAHCVTLSKIPRLVYLFLYRSSSVTVSGLEALARSPSVRHLHLHMYPLSPEWAAAISRMKCLESIYVHEGHDGLNDEALAPWGALPRLKYLGLSQCWGVKGDFLYDGFHNLEELELVQIPHDTGEYPTISANLEPNIAALPKLRSLTLAQFHFGRELRLDVLMSCSQLEEIWLDCNDYAGIFCRIGIAPSAKLKTFRFTRSWRGELDKTALNALPLLLPNLSELGFRGSVLGAELADWVGRFKKIERIDLSETEIEAETVLAIAALPTIRELVLSGCKRLSAEKIEEIRRKFPSKEFVYP